MAVLNFKILDISVLEWLIAFVVLLLCYGVLQHVKQLALRQVKRISERAPNLWNELAYREVSQTKLFFLLVLSLHLASLTLPLQTGPQEVVKLVTKAAMLIQIAIWGTALIDFLIYNRTQERESVDPSTATTMNAMNLMARLVLWAIIVLILLENIPGVQINSLIASLGITGIAVALAVQRILGDLFASLSITLDKPFVLGDFITVDQFQGTVEKIGLKSTRLRSLSGEQLIFSNTDLLTSRIHNYQRMARRRVQFPVRVSLKTPIDKLAEIPKMIQDSISSLDEVTFDRANFKEIGATAFLFDVVYYLETADYDTYMERQQAINLALLQRFQAAQIELGA